jgi:hypothetical protein
LTLAGTRDGGGVWTAYAAAAWAAIFAALHFVWAAGWYVGLDTEGARAAFAVPWKYAYNLGAGAMCAIAVPVALAFVSPWGRRMPRGWIVWVALIGTGLLVLRAAAGTLQWLYWMATGQFSPEAIGLWQPWFMLGATLFTIATWRFLQER